ncbi:MAG TPA: DUF4263 domain-containing protein [Cyclobacteriaceae bacterium]|nr:DUF4263 domain-containing protein [Cyclobacteriaceae bacterium]
MAKKAKKVAKKRASKSKTAKNYVIISNRGYGKKLKGVKIFFEGKKPSGFKKDGSIGFGKNILELLTRTFPKFQWIVTEDKNEIEVTYGVHRVRTSTSTLQKMYSQSFSLTKDIKDDIIRKNFSVLYPGHFKFDHAEKYKPGTIGSILKENILNDLSSEDKDELNKFIPNYAAKESVSVVSVLNATAQIKTLKELAGEMRTELQGNHSEKWWQDYIKKTILIIQQGYIKAIEKMNVALGNTQLPDFCLVTHDNFLDILEIKKPSTELIKEDSRNNFRWDAEISSAIIQIENYIEYISKNAESIRGYIKDKYKIDLKVVRPRGIVLAGVSSNFTTQKQRDDFRLLTLASKNIVFVTYDELITRLENFIEVLEQHSATK